MRARAEFGGVVLAVVEEAFLASDGPEDGVGDGEPLQAGGCDQWFGHVSTVRWAGYIDNLDSINIDRVNMSPDPVSKGRITATEAASRLGVKRETIYAYVSRGLLTSERHLDGKSSTFDPGEIDRLRRRKNDSRPGRLEVPVASAITEVVDGSVSYRNHRLDELVASGARFEAVAELLWTGTLDDTAAWAADPRVAAAVEPAVRALATTATPIDKMMAGVVAAGAADPFRHDRSAPGVITSGRLLVRTIVDALPRHADAPQ